jgi:hypothetical protein
MARSTVTVIAISMTVAGCAHGPEQPSVQSSEAIASVEQVTLPQASNEGEPTTLNDAPRHAQDSQNATVGEYVLPANEQPSTTAPQVQTPDPDFAKFDEIRRRVDGEPELGGPSDQGTSEIDRKLTERIRKAVLSDPRLSYNAKNIKIVTRDGQVTLRGTVNNAKERAALEEIATRASGSDRVDSEVKVK